jgi:putative transposase
MPNHLHLMAQVRETPLGGLVKGWKGRIAREANKLLGRQGAFWQRDYWDTYMRDEAQVIRARRYIEQNPVKAKLACAAEEWCWSSARFRDEYGRLERRIYPA